MIQDLIKEYILIFYLILTAYKSIPSSYKEGNKDLLVIPGFAEQWFSLKIITDYLNKNLDYKIHIIKDLNSFNSIDDITARVILFIKSKNLENFTILAHSKGGLVTLNLLTKPQIYKKINTIINISVPYKGTIWGLLSILNLKELMTFNKFLNNINLTQVPRNIRFINFYPKFDNNVIPLKSAILNLGGVINKQINIIGHTRILFSKKTLKQLAFLLK